MATASNDDQKTETIEQKEQEKTEEFPPELLIKHPLQNRWTFWYFEPDRTRSWEDSLREVTSFDTAEDFWGVWNHIKPASDLKVGCDYSLFKEGIRPMWEDVANKNGGRWLIELKRGQRQTDLDRHWLEIILCMIGEGFNEYSDEICGAVVNIRGKNDKISVWTADNSNSKAAMEIGRKLKERLMMNSKSTIPYQMHKDTMVKAGPIKTTYSV